MVSNKKKTKEQKRESKLSERVTSRSFVAALGFIDDDYGVFFALSAKSAPPVLRNKIKRVFKNMIKTKVLPLVEENKKKAFSLCLISKKGVKFSGFDETLRDELEKIVSKIVEKLG